MKKTVLKVLALVFAVTMLLSGCVMPDLDGWFASQMAIPFSQMKYTRPDVTNMGALLNDCCENAKTEKDVDVLLEKIWAFYNSYNTFYTNYNLASIYYYKDLTDTYWEQEYNYCLGQTAQVDAWLDQMFYALADCPLREELEASDSFEDGFFDDYDGDSLWDDTFTALMDRQSEMESQYNELCEQAQNVMPGSEEYYSGVGAKMAQLFVELVALRQEIAEYAGYENFLTFAYDFYHGRDYSPDEAIKYLQQVSEELTPLYMESAPLFADSNSWDSCSPESVFLYVESASNAMGGTIKEAFRVMDTAQLYDITYSNKKYDASFEVFLTDYGQPYVFVNPMGVKWDKLTFAHEFGHFCNDYASYGMKSGVDVAEVFSQGLEYLSLCYGDGAGELEQAKMLDTLSVFVEQSAYALFEHQVYLLEGEELTVENVQALYEKTCKAFGFDVWQWDSRDYVRIVHFYIAPMYVISYVVSNDVAFQIYQLEKEETGKGLQLYEKELTTTQPSMIAFTQEAGLTSPFAQGRLESIRETLETYLKTEQKIAA